MESYRLTEGVSFEIELTQEEFVSLQALGKSLSKRADLALSDEDDESEDEQSVIACRPIANGRYVLLVPDAIGVIGVGEKQFEIGPKIPKLHFDYLLARSFGLPRTSIGNVKIAQSPTYWHLVCGWFLDALGSLLRLGLMPGYSAHVERLGAVRGRIDLLRSTVGLLSGDLRVLCEYEDLALDTPLNRILRSALLLIVGSESLPIEMRNTARAFRTHFDDVGDLRPSDLAAILDRNVARYQNSIVLAREVLNGTGRSPSSGALRSWNFLLRTPILVETAIRSILAEHLDGKLIVTKKRLRIDGTQMTINPDLAFADVAVGDVKYKVLNHKWHRPDLYQAVFFAAGFSVGHGIVVGFSDQKRSLECLRVGEIMISRITWPTGDGIDPLEAEDRVVTQVEQWLTSVVSISTRSVSLPT